MLCLLTALPMPFGTIGATSPLYVKPHDLRQRTISMEYNDPKELLHQIHGQQGDDLFVASFSAIQHKETGWITSYRIWPERVEALLPETDDLVLLGPNLSDNVSVVAAGSFERVRDVADDVIQSLGTYSERFRVTEFPS